MIDKFTDELIRAVAFAFVGAILSLIGVSFTTWLHVRSLRKANRAAFKKIRKLERHTFGHPTSELDEPDQDDEDDSREFDR